MRNMFFLFTISYTLRTLYQFLYYDGAEIADHICSYTIRSIISIISPLLWEVIPNIVIMYWHHANFKTRSFRGRFRPCCPCLSHQLRDDTRSTLITTVNDDSVSKPTSHLSQDMTVCMLSDLSPQSQLDTSRVDQFIIDNQAEIDIQIVDKDQIEEIPVEERRKRNRSTIDFHKEDDERPRIESKNKIISRHISQKVNEQQLLSSRLLANTSND